ncbi:MAG: urease accessory protein UreH domain-containing protein [Candidatus Limnocylindrales bacterium]
MSRRRNRVRAQTASAPARPAASEMRGRAEQGHPAREQAVAPALAIAEAPSDEAEELHRRAVELREIRMGLRARPVAPTSTVTDAGTVSMTFPVMGMTCRSCEVRIGKFVGRLPGVERVSASAVKGQVTVECSAPVPAATIEKAINKAGYELGSAPWLVRDPVVWGTLGAGAVIVIGLAIAAQLSGVGDLAAAAGDISKGGVLVALLLGLAAGVSTCMALVGGLVLGMSASYQSSRPEGTGKAAQMRPALVLVGGRIVGYTLFGALLGALGASVAMPPAVTAVLMIGVAVVMLLLGTRLTGVSPRLAGWSPTLPMGLGRRLGLAGGGGGVAAYSDTRAATLGALTFFLPCGFTQAIQIFALSTGSPVYAAALLGTFAIGTAPGLLGLAGLPLVVPSRAKPTLLRLVGVLVIGFAVLNGSAGLRLSGFTLPSLVGTANAADPSILGSDGVERFTTYQKAGGYSPSNVTIYAGYPVEWTVVSSSTTTCAASIFAPGVDIRAHLSLGPNTFKLPALPVGVLRYTCAMGMYSAQITVVPKPSGVGASAPAAAASPSTPPASTPAPVASSQAAAASAAPSVAASAAPSSAAPSAASATPAVQELRTYQDESGYGPSDATIKAGIPTKWHVDSRSQYGCSAYIVVPSLSIEVVLKAGDNVIDLPALKAGKLEYTCAMGMYYGAIFVEPAGTSG